MIPLSPAAQHRAQSDSRDGGGAAKESHADVSFLCHALFDERIQALCLEVLGLALEQQGWVSAHAQLKRFASSKLDSL